MDERVSLCKWKGERSMTLGQLTLNLVPGVTICPECGQTRSVVLNERHTVLVVCVSPGCPAYGVNRWVVRPVSARSRLRGKVSR